MCRWIDQRSCAAFDTCIISFSAVELLNLLHIRLPIYFGICNWLEGLHLKEGTSSTHKLLWKLSSCTRARLEGEALENHISTMDVRPQQNFLPVEGGRLEEEPDLVKPSCSFASFQAGDVCVSGLLSSKVWSYVKTPASAGSLFTFTISTPSLAATTEFKAKPLKNTSRPQPLQNDYSSKPVISYISSTHIHKMFTNAHSQTNLHIIYPPP